jgi:hypothetical protein
MATCGLLIEAYELSDVYVPSLCAMFDSDVQRTDAFCFVAGKFRHVTARDLCCG